MRKRSRVESRESKVKSQATRDEGRGTRNKKRLRSEEPGIKSRHERNSHSALPAPHSPLIFGVLPVLEALRANAQRIERILVAEGGHEKRLHDLFGLARENHIPFQKVPRQNFSKLVEPGVNHQGVVAFVSAADYYDSEKLLDEISQKIEAGEKPLIVILDGIEDPRNLGAILRTCEGAGAAGVFIPERRAVGLTDTAAKSSAGATEYVKVAKVTNLNNLIKDLKQRQVWVVGTSFETKQNYTDWDWNQPTALVMGNEGKGLHRLVAENCDALLKIPMQGKIESLNVSVAAGVILFEAVRQRTVIN